MAFGFTWRVRGLVAGFSFLALSGAGMPAWAAGDSPFAADPDAFEKAMPPMPKIPAPKGVPLDTADNVGKDPLDALAPEQVPVPPFVETIDGMPAIRVKTARGAVREIKEGQQLEYGDRFQTGGHAVVRLVFEKGAQVLVGSNAAIGVYESASAPGEEKMPLVDVSKGETRILVPPAQEREPSSESDPKAQASPGPKRATIRFTVRTKSATMGVRGTDFIVNAETEKSEVHTLTGVVDMAENHENLKGGKGVVPVPAGQYTDRFAGTAINKARPFDTGTYMTEFKSRHPRMEGIFRQAAADHRTGKMQEKFHTNRLSRTIREANRLGIPIKRIRADGTPEVDKRGGKQRDRGSDGPGQRKGKDDESRDSGDRDGKRSGGPGGMDGPGGRDDGDQPKRPADQAKKKAEKINQMRRRRPVRPGALRPGGG